jgi:hypothetical protein
MKTATLGISVIGFFVWFTDVYKFIKPLVSTAYTAVGWTFKMS